MSFDLGNTFEISAVTGAPDPHKQQIALRLLTATSVKESQDCPSDRNLHSRNTCDRTIDIFGFNTFEYIVWKCCAARSFWGADYFQRANHGVF